MINKLEYALKERYTNVIRTEMLNEAENVVFSLSTMSVWTVPAWTGSPDVDVDAVVDVDMDVEVDMEARGVHRALSSSSS